ncbi:MAG TPA: YqcC family protein [Cyclobacteriaceae bacterium]|nr:YqcC family protein [Cyclobacteriaceae bacterium]
MIPPWQEAGKKADEIEACLRSINRWQAEPLPEHVYENMGPFGAQTMSFEQWIQFVLVPTIRDIVNERASFPPYSQVGVYAVRTLDGDVEAQPLVALLSELDMLIGTQPPDETIAPPKLGSVADLPFSKEIYDQIESLQSIELTVIDKILNTLIAFAKDLPPERRLALANLLFHAESHAQPAIRRLKINKTALKIRG